MARNWQMTPQRANFLLSIVIVLLVGGLMAAGIQRGRAAAAQMTTRNNLKSVGLAVHSFHDANQSLPPAFDRSKTMPHPVSIHVHLLPFVDQKETYDSFLADGAGNADAVVPV